MMSYLTHDVLSHSRHVFMSFPSVIEVISIVFPNLIIKLLVMFKT